MHALASEEAQQPARCLAVYKGHTDAVEDVAASPSGNASAVAPGMALCMCGAQVTHLHPDPPTHRHVRGQLQALEAFLDTSAPLFPSC